MSVHSASDSKTVIIDSTTGEPVLTPSKDSELEEKISELPYVTWKDDKFRLQGTRFFLTYSTWIPKDELEDLMRTVIPESNKLTFFRAAHETGDEINPYPHTHALVEYNKRIDKTGEKGSRVYDFVNDKGTTIHPNIQRVSSKEHFDNCKRYLAKEDTANADLLDDRSREEKLMQAFTTMPESERRAKIMFNNRGQINPLAVLNVEEIGNVLQGDILAFHKLIEPRGWQVDILSMLEEEMSFPRSQRDTRSPIWIYDYEGSSGKSAFADFLAINYPSQWFAMEAANDRDSSLILANAWAGRHWDATGLAINISRTVENFCPSVYKLIECIKDGKITSTKYKSKTLAINAGCIVMVTANMLPDKNRMSMNRWNLVFRIWRGKIHWVDPLADWELITRRDQFLSNQRLAKISKEIIDPSTFTNSVARRLANVNLTSEISEDLLVEAGVDSFYELDRLVDDSEAMPSESLRE